MELPKNFNVIEKDDGSLQYGINVDKNGKHVDTTAPRDVVIPTNTSDGNHVVAPIKGSGIGTWNIDDQDFPKREMFGELKGSAKAAAVLDDKHELVAIAIGRGNGDDLTVARIKQKDGTVTVLDEDKRITVDLKDAKDVDKLSELVTKEAKKHERASDIILEGGEPIIKSRNQANKIPNLAKLESSNTSQVEAQNSIPTKQGSSKSV